MEPVSVVLPALDTRDLFERNLPSVLAEVERRAVGDEVIVVDDTGADVLAAWFAERFPAVRVIARAANGGFAQALRTGVEGAGHALVFSLNTDVRLRPGCLDALVEVLADPRVAGVSPRVLLDGDESAPESTTHFDLVGGLLRLERSDLDGPAPPEPKHLHGVPFAVGGTLLFRAEEFLAGGGFDPLFEPFYLEDVDWAFQAWRAGRKVLVEPAAVVEHHHRGTIGNRVDKGVVRAAIERNRLLFLWKHLDDPQALEEHLEALASRAVNAWLCGEREPLVWLFLALQDRDAALAARAGRPAGESFADVLARLRGLSR